MSISSSSATSSSASSSNLVQSSYPNQGLIVLGTGPSSGINYTTILNALEKSLSEPITLMQQQETPLNNKLSAWNTIKADVSALQSAASALGQPSLFTSFTASSSNTSVATASASSSAIAGTYPVTVNYLAQANIQASSGVASSSATVGTGTFGITVNGNTTNISITSSNDTLEGLEQAINNAGAGVTASIINNGNATNPYQLVLQSNNTGTNYAMTITNSLSGGSNNLTFSTTQSAVNASLTYGGIPITSQSNTVTGVIPGVSLSLLASGTSTITVALNSSAIDSAVNNFTTSYNQLITDASTQLQYDSSTKSLGPLGGDSTLTGLINSIYNYMGSEMPTLSGSAGIPSTYGLTQSSDGSGILLFNSATLNSMLTTNPSQTQGFLSALANGSSTADGVSEPAGLTNMLNGYTNSYNGAIMYAENSINSQLTNMNNQISLQKVLVQQRMGIYTKQFSALESYIGQMQTTNSTLANSIKQLQNG